MYMLYKPKYIYNLHGGSGGLAEEILKKSNKMEAFPLLAHLSRRLMGELIVYQSLCRPSVNIFKHLLL